jgi:hypothetical protein
MACHKTMKPSANPFFRPACWVAVLACCALPAQADTLYRDGITSTVKPMAAMALSTIGTPPREGGTDSVRATNNIAVFGGTAGTVSLGAGVQAGGSQFDTASYLVQSNALPAA